MKFIESSDSILNTILYHTCVQEDYWTLKDVNEKIFKLSTERVKTYFIINQNNENDREKMNAIMNNKSVIRSIHHLYAIDAKRVRNKNKYMINTIGQVNGDKLSNSGKTMVMDASTLEEEDVDDI